MRITLWMLLLIITGCGQQPRQPLAFSSPDTSRSESTQNTQPPARRIVSLSPGLTELIYAVGAEQFLVATVEYSDYPQEAKAIPRIGDAFRVDMERVLALQPDLVLAWNSGTAATTIEEIQSLGLRVESIDVTHIHDVSTSLIKLGDLTGLQDNAKKVAESFEQAINELRSQYQDRMPVSVFIEVNSHPLYTVNGQHILSEVVKLCGGRNVLADLNQLAPIVSTEAVLKANPEVILSADGTLTQLKQEWQEWSQMNAVKNNHLYVVSPDITTRATPRLIYGAREVCEALDRARKTT